MRCAGHRKKFSFVVASNHIVCKKLASRPPCKHQAGEATDSAFYSLFLLLLHKQAI
jgi:hypothetical protein